MNSTEMYLKRDFRRVSLIIDHTFFILLVKPAGPNITKCFQKKNKEKVEVVVTPPSTWPQPHSFFPLKHQIEYEIRDNGKVR